MNSQFFNELHKIECASAELPPFLRAKVARAFRFATQAEKEAARDVLFNDLVAGAEALGQVIGQVKALLLIPEGFQGLPINGDSVEARLRELHRRLVDAAAVMTETGGLLYPEACSETTCVANGIAHGPANGKV